MKVKEENYTIMLNKIQVTVFSSKFYTFNCDSLKRVHSIFLTKNSSP